LMLEEAGREAIFPDLPIYLARPEGVEPPTYRSVVCRSVQLSYGRTLIVKNILTYISSPSPPENSTRSFINLEGKTDLNIENIRHSAKPKG
jgi:hypothetical protein